jgi:hypothetical protein
MELSIGVLSLSVTLFLAWTGFLLGAVKYLLDKKEVQQEKRLTYLEERLGTQAEQRQALERDIWSMRTMLAQDYIKREDWVRFGTALDSKIDRLGEQMRILYAQRKE